MEIRSRMRIRFVDLVDDHLGELSPLSDDPVIQQI